MCNGPVLRGIMWPADNLVPARGPPRMSVETALKPPDSPNPVRDMISGNCLEKCEYGMENPGYGVWNPVLKTTSGKQ